MNGMGRDRIETYNTIVCVLVASPPPIPLIPSRALKSRMNSYIPDMQRLWGVAGCELKPKSPSHVMALQRLVRLSPVGPCSVPIHSFTLRSQ